MFKRGLFDKQSDTSEEDDILNRQIDFNKISPGEQEDNFYSDLLMQRKGIDMTKKLARFMWRQNNPHRMNWDLLIIFLALYNCILIPLNLAFTKELTDSPVMNIIERIIDVLFIGDIVLNFRTTYINPSTNIEIIDPVKVAKNYT